MVQDAHPREPDGLLRRVRLARGLTVAAAARLAGVSASRVSQVERAESAGTLRLDTLERFASALGYRLRYELAPSDPVGDPTATFAAEGAGGYITVRDPATEAPSAVLRRLEAEGILTRADDDLATLPPPPPPSARLLASLGGRTLTEVLLADREADLR
ncbi:MAG: helix-turn-helix domain-containing protein [Nitriliruptoraceae bacterium]